MLHVHRAERADGLVGALRELLARPLDDPFQAEVVAVPTRGMERWLTQRLSGGLGASAGRGDGICANVDFPSPRRLVDGAIAVAAGIDPDADPWLVEHAIWSLLDVVEDCLQEPWLQSLAVHLGGRGEQPDPVRRARRLGAVRHIAELLDRYALQRPAMVRAWADGLDVDGAGRELAEEGRWQAELWRRLRAQIGAPGPAERVQHACARLRDEPAIVQLPARLSLFGLTRLPAGQLDVLRALGAARDVHLFILHPSPALWERVAQRAAAPVRRRAEDPTATLAANRLLASWARDARELQLALAAAEAEDDGQAAAGLDADADLDANLPADADHHHPVAQRSDTLLARVQADVRADRAAPGPPLPGHDDDRPALDPADASLRVHACHGRARQVEVTRDAILHLLADDSTLQPRDVIVMCPDIETFAPLIQATFGTGAATDDEDDDPEETARALAAAPPDLRVRLADRALRQTNPVLGVVAALLDLPGGRLTASQVLDLADRDPVRRRFGLDDDDLTRIAEWIAASGIRWGLDAADRAPFKLDSLAAGTWRAGLDRLLVGVAMTEDGHHLYEGVLPLDDVESGAIDLAGRFAELVDRLGAALDGLGRSQPVAAWAQAIGAAADALTATSPRDGWQRAELQRLLDGVVAETQPAGGAEAVAIAPAEIRALLAERLQGRPTRANFRTGHLTICTLVPMRSVPHRVVCLLGLDDGAFPRKAHRDGDDLLLQDPHVGDRDARSEDRQLLLDALLAATDNLIVTYTGNDERTNAPQPPAVPVGELLDVVDRTVRVAGGGAAREHVVVRHPLQPFDPRNFEPGRVEGERPWSFDAVALDGARALGGPRAGERPFLRGPLAALREPVVELDDLLRFAQRPVRAFLRRRLGLRVTERSDEIDDALPVALDGLEVWGVGQRLLDGLLAGAEIEACIAAEVARGTLPPGELGAPVIARVRPTVQEIAAQADRLLAGAGAPGSLEVGAPGSLQVGAPGSLEVGASGSLQVGASGSLQVGAPGSLQVGAPGSLQVGAPLAGGRILRGTVAGVCGDVLRAVTYSRVSARHRLTAWVRLLALTASHPQRAFEAVTIGRAQLGAGGARVTVARIPALGADPETRRARALHCLSTLLDLHDRGMREALPIACLSSAAHAQAARRGTSTAKAARDAWTSTWNFDREDREPEHELVLGGQRTLDELLAAAPHADESGPGWDGAETTRFGRYAVRLWDDLLACEEVVDR